MVARGVRGLDRFKEHMVGLEDSYAVIGGTACEVLLEDADLEFRATKDIDMVLLVEGRLPEAAAAVWRLLRGASTAEATAVDGKGRRVPTSTASPSRPILDSPS